MDGQVGSGKSVALFSLALWARQNGWLVVYVPSAYAFIEGGFFAVDEEDGMVDAWDAALLLLRSIMDSHADMLQARLVVRMADTSAKDCSCLIALMHTYSNCRCLLAIIVCLRRDSKQATAAARVWLTSRSKG